METSLSGECRGGVEARRLSICWLQIWTLEDQAFVLSYFIVSVLGNKNPLSRKGLFRKWELKRILFWRIKSPVRAASERNASLGASTKKTGEFGELAWIQVQGGESVPSVTAQGLLIAWWERAKSHFS